MFARIFIRGPQEKSVITEPLCALCNPIEPHIAFEHLFQCDKKKHIQYHDPKDSFSVTYKNNKIYRDIHVYMYTHIYSDQYISITFTEKTFRYSKIIH